MAPFAARARVGHDRLVATVRDHLVNAIRALPAISHARMKAILDEVGVPEPPNEQWNSKATYAAARAAMIRDEDVDDFAQRLVAVVREREGALLFDEIFALEEALWVSAPRPRLARRTRHDLARHLGEHSIEVFREADAFIEGLQRLGVIAPENTVRGAWFGLRPRIEQHMVANDDWGWWSFLEAAGAFDWSDRRFIGLLELAVSPRVRPSIDAQREFVRVANMVLAEANVELRESGLDGGYPVFAVALLNSAARGRPKNIIFASRAIKPDLRLLDAVTNEIEIVSDPNHVLIYDSEIPPDGLRWRDLENWWALSQGIRDREKAKRTLWDRLRESIPRTSPPQLRLFKEYHDCFKTQIPELPALLPEVYLHYDPRTVRERGFDALIRQRMDFLLLLPHGVRVVIEVDGKSHFADDDDRANPTRYAELAAADRELRLAGYEVYHFGATELMEDRASDVVRDFFVRLYGRHGLVR
jgi:hypothetical protein